jgi:hypothetical protein
MKSLSIVKNFFFFIIIISIPFLDFFSYNLGNLDERTDLAVNSLTLLRLLILFLIFLIIGLFVIIILQKTLKLKNFDANLLTGSFIFIFFQYSNFKNILVEVYEFLEKKINISLHYNSVLEYNGEVSLLILLLISYLVFKVISKKLLFIKYLLTFYFIFNSLFFTYEIITKYKFKYKNTNKELVTENLKFDKKNGKNIYFFIIDAMPPLEVADKFFNSNSDIFVNRLKDKGYEYIPNTQTIYGSTFLTIGSMFNMNKVKFNNNGMPEKKGIAFPAVMKKENLSNLEYNLKELNYEIKWVGSHFANCHGYNKEYCIKNENKENILFSYESLRFLKKTPIKPIITKLFLAFGGGGFEEKIIFNSNNAMNVFIEHLDINGKPNGSTFFLIHHLISHWPYLVDSSCSFKKHVGRDNMTGIEDAYICNKKLISKITDKINKIDKEAIVVFQSDHNWELSNINPNKYTKRNRIFNLIKINDECKKYLGKEIDNINAVRLSLFCANNTKPILLELSEN